MASRLRLGFERVRDNDEPEVGFFGDSTLHGFMVRMHMRIVNNLKTGRTEALCDLHTIRSSG